MRLLVVEDDPDLNRQLTTALSDAGYVVDRAFDGEEGHFLGDSEPYDAVVLDIGLPKMDGISVLESWRRNGRIMPVLILTARDRWSDKVQGFDAGADDYVAKPFEPRELVLRIGNILKRTAPPPVETLEQVAFGPYVYHLDRGELRQGEETIHLTDREREMLRILAVAPGETVPRSALTGDGSVNERAVDVQINRLRRKIEKDPANPLFLQAVRGVGYRLVASP